MTYKKHPSLDQLRKSLTTNQRAILNEIWLYFLQEKKIITAVSLYTKFGKEVVNTSLATLGGSIVFRTGNPDTGRQYYHLTFLGKLMCDTGKEGQQLIEKYLEYLRSRLESEPEISGITEEDLKRDLQFTEQQLTLFRDTIVRSPFWNGSNNNENPRINTPPDVDDLSVANDIHGYFEARALRDYDPKRPLDFTGQHGTLRTDGEEDISYRRQSVLTKAQLGLLGFGAYALYILYVVSSEGGRYGGLYAFQDRFAWWMALGQTLWFLIAVLAALLFATVLGTERFINLLHGLMPFTKRLSLLQPIQTEVATTATVNESEADEDVGRSGFSEETGLGLQLYLDYNDSIKKVYNNAILQYRNSFYFSLIFATVGFGVIFYTLIFKNNGNTSWPAVVVSAVIESVPALFFYLSDKARKQMIDVFVDLRHDNEVARAYELLRTLKNPDKLEALKEEIVRHTLLSGIQESGSTKHALDH